MQVEQLWKFTRCKLQQIVNQWHLHARVECGPPPPLYELPRRNCKLCILDLGSISPRLRSITVNFSRRLYEAVAQQAEVLTAHEFGQCTVAFIGYTSGKAVASFVVNNCGRGKQRVRVERLPELIRITVEEARGYGQRVPSAEERFKKGGGGGGAAGSALVRSLAEARAVVLHEHVRVVHAERRVKCLVT